MTLLKPPLVARGGTLPRQASLARHGRNQKLILRYAALGSE
jgi:hypothetical protein